MARHDQKPKREHLVCKPCSEGHCHRCVDVYRYLAGKTDPICPCRKKDHGGEARDVQVKDPFTGTVHAPGLTVDIDGNVKYR